MPFLTAHRIHNGKHWLPEGTVIEVSEDGTIIQIQDGDHPESVFFEGILAPGFINAHCHLELSHMKDVVPEHTGLIPFLKTIPLHRNDFTEEQKKVARHNACKELLGNGVVAVGDIANTTDTLDVREYSGLRIHTFVESIGFNEERAELAFGFAKKNYEQFADQAKDNEMLSQSIAPHAPYSVSGKLMGMISDFVPESLITIHNQESREENKYFENKTGGVGDLLRTLGIDDTPFIPTGKSSLQSYLSKISPQHPVIFVHNSYSKVEDVKFAQTHLDHTFWCMCPNANLYIEHQLPDIEMLISEGVTICVGTDSLASNHGLSIFDELKTIHARYPQIDWEILLRWGTNNGAKALQLDGSFGSIEPGMRPGIVHLPDLAGEVVNRVM